MNSHLEARNTTPNPTCEKSIGRSQKQQLLPPLHPLASLHSLLHFTNISPLTPLRLRPNHLLSPLDPSFFYGCARDWSQFCTCRPQTHTCVGLGSGNQSKQFGGPRIDFTYSTDIHDIYTGRASEAVDNRPVRKPFAHTSMLVAWMGLAYMKCRCAVRQVFPYCR